MAEACETAKEEESHFEGFKWRWVFPGFNVFIATLISSPWGSMLMMSTRKQHKVSKNGGGVGRSPLSLYALSFLVFKSARTRCSEYNKRLVVLYHTPLWEQNSSRTDLKRDVTLTFQNEALSRASPVKAQRCDSFSSILRGLLSRNHCNWKEGHVIASVHHTRYLEVPTTYRCQENQQWLLAAAREGIWCAHSGTCPSWDVCEKFGWSSHVWIPCANGMLLRCFGNNNISVSIMSYFIKCWVAKVLEQLLCSCRVLNTQSDHLFSIWGKTCPSTFLNTLKLLLVCLKQHMKVLLLSNILSYSGLRSLPKSSRSESSVIQVCVFKTYYRHRDNFIWILL